MRAVVAVAGKVAKVFPKFKGLCLPRSGAYEEIIERNLCSSFQVLIVNMDSVVQAYQLYDDKPLPVRRVLSVHLFPSWTQDFCRC